MIITKSISRFARNTVTVLQSVRELKAIGVDVFFEEQNIHSLSGEGEFMLSVLSSFAQEESRSCSENCKWRIRKDFQEGRPNTGRLLGYRLSGGVLTVVPEDAETVREIYRDYLKLFPKAHKLIELALSDDSLTLTTLDINGVLTTKDYPIYLSEYYYKWNENELYRYDYTPKKIKNTVWDPYLDVGSRYDLAGRQIVLLSEFNILTLNQWKLSLEGNFGTFDYSRNSLGVQVKYRIWQKR